MRMILGLEVGTVEIGVGEEFVAAEKAVCWAICARKTVAKKLSRRWQKWPGRFIIAWNVDKLRDGVQSVFFYFRPHSLCTCIQIHRVAAQKADESLPAFARELDCETRGRGDGSHNCYPRRQCLLHDFK